MARLHRKKIRPDKGKLTDQQQLKRGLHAVGARSRSEKRRPKTQSKPDGIFAKIMLVINVILCLLLLYLLVFDRAPQSIPVFTKYRTPIRLYDYIEEKTRIPSVEQDNMFLNTALEHDESTEHEMFRLKTELQKDDAEINVPDDEMKGQIAFVDSLNLTDEQSYELYEEKQPEESVSHETAKKPAIINADRPLIAVVIDDMGVNVRRTKDIIGLHYPLTSSFLTYASGLSQQMQASRNSGHEVMGHIPMEPQIMQNFTPTMLTTQMSDEQILSTFRQMLAFFPNIKAVNNHMGSKFTEDKHRMDIVMKELSKHNLIFLDSVTTQHSAAPSSAADNGVKILVRNVFLDNKDDFDYITAQLHLTERIARQNGYAIAIGHPKEQTYKALKAWLPTLDTKGLRLVKLSKILEHMQQ